MSNLSFLTTASSSVTIFRVFGKWLHLLAFEATPYRIIGPSCRIWSRSTRGLSLLRSRWMNMRVSCTSTEGRSVKSSVKPCQILSPAERYVELRYNAAVVSAVKRETETSTEAGSLILTQPSLSPSSFSQSRRRASRRRCAGPRHRMHWDWDCLGEEEGSGVVGVVLSSPLDGAVA